jgi:signal transduction histidine kinase
MASEHACATDPGPRSRQRTLARELVIAYLIVAVLVGALLSLVSMWTVNRLETHLQQIDMGMALDRVRGEYLAGKDVGRGSRFFHGEPGSETFPDWLRQIEPGFTRIEHDERDWHVIADDRDGVRYVLLRDYTAFEQRRVHSHWITVLCVGASLFIAFLLGGAVTRRLVRPLAGLAEQVIKRPALPPQTRIAHAYPGNEIGRLAAAFDATYNQLEMALQRERLFTADVSHELRTPLTVISSSCELLLDDPQLTPTLQQKLQRVHSASIDIHQQLAAYLMLARDSSDASGLRRLRRLRRCNRRQTYSNLPRCIGAHCAIEPHPQCAPACIQRHADRDSCRSERFRCDGRRPRYRCRYRAASLFALCKRRRRPRRQSRQSGAGSVARATYL